MVAGPIDTAPKLAQCEKCSAYVFQADVNGCRIIVDPAPLAEPLQALAAGRVLYERTPTGKLRVTKTLDGPKLGQHGCTVRATVRASAVEVAPEGPQQAPVTHGGTWGGFRHPRVRADGSQGHTAKITTEGCSEQSPSAAAPATHHPSKRKPKPTRCTICREVITGDEPNIIAIEFDGRILWGYHVDH